MNLDNSPLKKMKEKKGEAHTPTISTPFTTIEPQQTITEQPTQPTIKAPKSNTSEPKKTKAKHTFIISEDLLFTLQAYSNYKQKTINGIIETSLNNYFKDIDTEELNKAKEIYTQLLKLKGVANYGNN